MIRAGRLKTILVCMKCKEAFYPTIYDLYPAYGFDEESKSFIEKYNNDEARFRAIHKDHKITQLQVINDSFYSQYPYWEPVREDYFMATDGSSNYILKRWRKNINKPLRYQIIDAYIEFEKPDIQVQSDKLKEQMIADSNKLGLTERKVNEFVKCYEDFVSGIELNDVIECGSSANDPMVSYAALKAEIMETFINDYYSYFSEDDVLRGLRIFMRDNSEYDDVMNLRVKRCFRLTGNSEQASQTSKNS